MEWILLLLGGWLLLLTLLLLLLILRALPIIRQAEGILGDGDGGGLFGGEGMEGMEGMEVGDALGKLLFKFGDKAIDGMSSRPGGVWGIIEKSLFKPIPPVKKRLLSRSPGLHPGDGASGGPVGVRPGAPPPQA